MKNYKRVIGKSGEEDLIMHRTKTAIKRQRRQRGRGLDIQKLLSKSRIKYQLPGYQFLGFTHVTNSLATVTIRHLGVPQA